MGPSEFRLILNLSILNLYIQTNRFEMTNHLTATKLIQTPAWFSTVDIMDAFLSDAIQNEYFF